MKFLFYIKTVLINIFAFITIIAILKLAIGSNSGINFDNSVKAIFILGLMILILAIIHAAIIDRLPQSKEKNKAPKPESAGLRTEFHARGDKYKTSQIREINLKIDNSKAFEICKNFIILEKCKIKTENKEKTLILASTPYSFLSWGDRIKFEINRNGDNFSKVKLTVYPILFVSMIDFGKNFKMAERALEFINKNSLQQFSDK